ncbi:serine protease inhibitor dipetalogastin-like [Colias croceus]|uniref:serine protease inhibitor dipetalogastin-like n=1 Tax=Colias crocea TaxID=72248 RepID=UPI001E28034B|nr:serine protease inhibitor dipetalogastin-like [Colias croceus]
MREKSYVLVLLLQSGLIAANSYVQQSVVETQPICPCEYKYNPVCGSDGITYMNDCVLQCISNQNPSLNKIGDGECESCICQYVNLPVCSLGGLTFPNECELACENKKRINAKQPIIYLAYRAACVGPSTGCTDLASPVCGTDDILYRNKCVLDVTSSYLINQGNQPIEVKNNGACLDGCLCPQDTQPVCGSNGCIYNNPCYIACQNRRNSCSKYPYIDIADDSVCYLCHCKPEQNPVCGTDGRTYDNPCELNCEAKKPGSSYLAIASYGKCAGCYCTQENIPVCSSDQKTYTNECHLRCANSADGGTRSVYYYGECQPRGCSCYTCPPEYQPMCGTDGRTYWNLCWLNCNAGCLSRDKNTSQSLFLKKRGACEL